MRTVGSMALLLVAAGILRHRQGEAYGRAASRLAVDVQLAPVGDDEVLDDRQPEAGAAELPRAGPVDPVEALGDARQVGPRDADAGVGHAELDRTGHGAA